MAPLHVDTLTVQRINMLASRVSTLPLETMAPLHVATPFYSGESYLASRSLPYLLKPWFHFMWPHHSIVPVVRAT